MVDDPNHHKIINYQSIEQLPDSKEKHFEHEGQRIMVFKKDNINCTCCIKKATRMICIHELVALKHIGNLNEKQIMLRCDKSLLFCNYKHQFKLLLGHELVQAAKKVTTEAEPQQNISAMTEQETKD